MRGDTWASLACLVALVGACEAFVAPRPVRLWHSRAVTRLWTTHDPDTQPRPDQEPKKPPPKVCPVACAIILCRSADCV